MWISDFLVFESEWDWLLNVTCNDISVIYVKAHRYAGGLKKKMDQRWGFKCHRLFIEFFNVPVQEPKLGQHFKDRPILVAFFYTHWDREKRMTHSRLNPPGPRGSLNKRFKIVENCGVKAFGDFHFYLRPVCVFSSFWYRIYIFVKCIIQSVFLLTGTWFKYLLSFNYKKNPKRHYMYNFSGRSLMVTSMFSCYPCRE